MAREELAQVREQLRTLGAAALAIPAAATVAAGCSGSVAKNPAAATTVRMSEFAYAPQALTVPRDAKVTVVNDGKVLHNWIVERAGVRTAEVRPGATQVLDLTGIAPGTYTVDCDQPGHATAGQTGTLIVSG